MDGNEQFTRSTNRRDEEEDRRKNEIESKEGEEGEIKINIEYNDIREDLRRCEISLIGRIVSDKPVHKNVVEAAMGNIWGKT